MCDDECTVYSQQPIPCWDFDCWNDGRVQLDFEGLVFRPHLHEPDWLACLEEVPWVNTLAA
jgi:hypothetical protein